MTETAGPPGARTPGAPGGDTAPASAVPDDVSELRSLILGPDHERRIDALYARLEDPDEMARAIGPVLPDAIARRGHDPQLARALEPSIEHAITASVRRNPRPLADALFPVIGPAIRSAIAHTLGTMLETLNRTLEQSVSWRALRWRLEAARTGRPFAEVVLLHTLEYRVEQVFLIHRETGLLLQHAAAGSASAHDADMVSAMLTAIRDFVRDSFGAGSEDGLDALRVGDLSVLVAQGPYAIVAGVVRGTPPPELRAALQDALETVHLQFATDLAAFAGDSRPLDAARPILESCLLARYRSERRGAVSRGFIVAAIVAAAVLAVWVGLSIRDGRRWDRYVSRLQAEPGLLVIDAGRRGRTFSIAGLRDPLAADPAIFLAGAGVPADRVVARWQFYQALDPAFVLQRAGRVLRTPPGVTLRLTDGVLSADGAVPPAWVLDAERLAPMIAGVRGFDAGVMRAAERALYTRIEAVSIRFVRGQAEPVPGQDAVVADLARALREANDLARSTQRRIVIRFSGHTDADGDDTLNVPLSLARARAILAILAPRDLGALELVTEGVGSSRPLATGGTETDKQQNRRVSFAVVAEAAPEGRR